MSLRAPLLPLVLLSLLLHYTRGGVSRLPFFLPQSSRNQPFEDAFLPTQDLFLGQLGSFQKRSMAASTQQGSPAAQVVDRIAEVEALLPQLEGQITSYSSPLVHPQQLVPKHPAVTDKFGENHGTQLLSERDLEKEQQSDNVWVPHIITTTLEKLYKHFDCAKLENHPVPMFENRFAYGENMFPKWMKNDTITGVCPIKYVVKESRRMKEKVLEVECPCLTTQCSNSGGTCQELKERRTNRTVACVCVAMVGSPGINTVLQ